MVTEVPGGMMSLAVQGLQQPLVLALRLRHQVMRVKVRHTRLTACGLRAAEHEHVCGQHC
jgi:hypothetical protein